jgi:hypothetical protein
MGLAANLGGDAASFKAFGDTVEGEYVSDRTEQRENLKKELEDVLIITLREADGSMRDLFARWAIKAALRTAMVAANLDDINPGDWVKVTYTADKAASTRGHQAAKLYEATVTRPVKSLSTSDL